MRRRTVTAVGSRLCAAAVWVCVGSAASATIPEPDVLDADDPMVIDDLGKTETEITGSATADEDVVLAAQKVRTTIQEAPAIITVITRKQIAERGYRTINEVLSSVAGFEGDRWEANGWHKESFARGIPRGVLVLINGVNVVEPVRNYINLDRKYPLEMVERIEVTSGPGGVLWGSNALLGVVNIVTRRPDDKGFHAIAGFGDGPADRLQFKAGLGYSNKWGEDFGLFAHASVYSTMGSELRVDQQKIIGAVPEPAPDSPTLYLPESTIATPGERSYYFNFSGRLEMGPVAIDWVIPWEKDYRAVGFGNASVTNDYLQTGGSNRPTESRDSVRMVSLSVRDRFLGGDLGLNARAYVVQWEVNENPFRIYSASPVTLANFNHDRELSVAFSSELTLRPGLAIDIDYAILDNLTLVTGAEGFFDINQGYSQRSWATTTNDRCPDGFTHDPADEYLPCHIDDLQVADVTRFIGGVFANLDWKPVAEFALTAGARLQASDTYDPAVLFSGGFVWNFYDKMHWKGFVSTGLRPPGTASTHVQDTTSGISFKANPDLRVEQSRSYETEVNMTVLRDVGPVRDLFLRFNGAYTQMFDVIKRPAGVFQNSGERQIWSAEALLRLRFDEGHEIWGNYTFTKVLDETVEGGELRNIAQHMGNVGATFNFLDGLIELTGWATIKGEMFDPNRPAIVDATRPDYSITCAQLSKNVYPEDFGLAQLQALCSMPGMEEALWVLPGTSVTERLKPVVLLNLGVRFKNIWRDLTASIFVHNALDWTYYEPDFFLDARVISRPQPKPGLSVFGQLSIGL